MSSAARIAGPDRSALAAWQAELAGQFAARRCNCGAPATCIKPGEEYPRETIAGVINIRGRDRPDTGQCLACASVQWRAYSTHSEGLPASHRLPQRRRVRA
jgi:hypothetical protein